MSTDPVSKGTSGNPTALVTPQVTPRETPRVTSEGVPASDPGRNVYSPSTTPVPSNAT